MENYLQSRKIKGVLLAVGTFLTIFLALKSWEVAQDISAPRLDRPSIAISGEGKVLIKPDIGQVNLSVISEAVSVSDAEKKATELNNKVLEALKKDGVQEKDIKATSYNISPKYGYGKVTMQMYPYPSDSPSITGYTVSQNLEVKIRELDKAGQILADAAKAGANQVGGLTFTTEDPTAVQADARAKAIEDANQKAQDLEKKLGIKLGKVIGFYESGGPYPVYRDFAYGKGGLATADSAPAIPVGENEVVVNVTITYQIK